jgi:phospholipid/cholesterol/gamma-HCH transport system permease protein
MPLVNAISSFGSYVLLLGKVFSRPDRWSVFFRQFIREVYKLIIDSIWIVVIISIFIGAVITIQMQLNMFSPLFPRYTVGLATRDTLLLEFSSAIMCLILAGKVGSNIASEIGTMRVTEQIDALDIMGVNSANYLIMPKIAAMVVFIPILVVLSMATGLFGGYLVALFTDMISVSTYVFGIQAMFDDYYVWYSIEKSVVFAFIIASISSYYGYNVRGGALEVGKASTDAVVMSSIIILLFDVILTKLLLQ